MPSACAGELRYSVPISSDNSLAVGFSCYSEFARVNGESEVDSNNSMLRVLSSCPSGPPQPNSFNFVLRTRFQQNIVHAVRS